MATRERGELLGLLRPCFARVGPWLQAGKYVAALASDLPKRNGWTIAQQAGDRTPQRTQRLLNRAVWDTVAAMGVVRDFAVAGLDEAARRSGRRRGLRIGAVDETSQVKQGTATAGVKRHYVGCVGKVANGISTVHLAYVRERTGHALIGARQWIPAGHLTDPVKPLAMGLPEDLVFRTKGQLAIDLLTETLTGGTRLDFVCGDEVDGSCTELREFCEQAGQGYVLRVPLELPPHAGARCHRDVRASRHPAAEGHTPLGGPRRGQGFQGRALVCLGPGSHGQLPPPSADPPASQDR